MKRYCFLTKFKQNPRQSFKLAKLYTILTHEIKFTI
jgi:hypothetical protein